MRVTLKALSLQMLLALCLCAAAFGNARAQGDIRLSTDPLQASIPDDMKIQAAGAINSLRLVVWGSTRLTAGNAVTGVLYMQMLRDTTPLGSPLILTSADARPFGYVRVMALTDRFMVCWNDRRGVAYERIVDTAGEVGDEKAFWGELLMGDIFSIPTTEGYTLLWNNSRDSSIYSRRIDHRGEFLGDAGIYSSGHLGAYHYPTKLPGLAILDRGNLPPILLDGNGRNIPLGAAAAKLTLPYYLDDDGSVVTIKNDTFREYVTILDSVPRRTLRVQLENGAINPTELVWRRMGCSVSEAPPLTASILRTRIISLYMPDYSRADLPDAISKARIWRWKYSIRSDMRLSFPGRYRFSPEAMIHLSSRTPPIPELSSCMEEKPEQG
ncbi:MAG: hypothetical protein ABIR47_18010 [Candidatus Kapaibacterium sp.]